MRKFGLLPAILALNCLSYSQTTPSKPASSAGAESRCAMSHEIAVRETAERWKDGYNRGDASSIADLYREDAYYLTQHFVKNGILHGRPNIQAYVERGIDAKYPVDSIQRVHVECSGDFAYTIGQRVHKRWTEGIRRQRGCTAKGSRQMANSNSRSCGTGSSYGDPAPGHTEGPLMER